MAAKTILAALAVICVVHPGSAWPWDRKTTVAPAPSRAAFLAQVDAASAAVQQAAALSQAKVQEVERGGLESTMADKVTADVDAWSSERRGSLEGYADDITQKAERYGVDVAAALPVCLQRYDAEIADVKEYVTEEALQYVHRDVQDVRDTATGAATLVAQIAEVVNDAQAEAAKPDSEFGGNVGAILAAAKKIEKKAAWNNAHIDAVVEGLQWSAGTVLTLTEAETDVSGIVDYLALCMRRALRTAYSNKQ